MGVPKRKLSRSRRDKKHANKFIRPKAFTACSNCEAPKMPHQACLECGFYRGKKVLATKADRGVKRAEVQAAKKGKAAEAKSSAEKE